MATMPLKHPAQVNPAMLGSTNRVARPPQQSLATRPSPTPTRQPTLPPIGNVASAPRPPQQPENRVPFAAVPVTTERVATTSPVTRLVNAHLTAGKLLASRGAMFSARDEFVHALRVVAQGLDVQQQTTQHIRALTAGMRALDEADDFSPSKDSLGAVVDVQQVAEAHNTPVLAGEGADLPSVVAQQKYYEYAREQLAQSAEVEPGAADALFALGKLYGSMESSPSVAVRIQSASTKAVVFYQAALAVDGQHASAANELGVLLAKFGREEEALGWLRRSAQLRPTAEAWHNVAVVHKRLGQMQYAAQAEQMVAQARGGQRSPNLSSNTPDVQWISPEQFAQTQVPNMDATLKPANRAVTPTLPTADARSAAQPEETKKKWYFW